MLAGDFSGDRHRVERAEQPIFPSVGPVSRPGRGVVAAFAALASPLALLHDPDTYLHIAAGRWMLAHWALPAADPFSFTMAGAQWIAGEWFGELVLAAVYVASGWGGIVVLTVASFGLAMGLLAWFLGRRLEPLPAMIAALAGAVLVLPHL